MKVEEVLLANPKLAMHVFSTLKAQTLTGRVPTLAEWHEAFLLEENHVQNYVQNNRQIN